MYLVYAYHSREVLEAAEFLGKITVQSGCYFHQLLGSRKSLTRRDEGDTSCLLSTVCVGICACLACHKRLSRGTGGRGGEAVFCPLSYKASLSLPPVKSLP